MDIIKKTLRSVNDIMLLFLVNSFYNKTSGLIIVFIILFFCGVYGQANFLLKKYDASFDEITLEEAFHQLTKTSSCQFSFNANLLPLNRKVNQKFYNKTLLFILTSLLSEYDVGFKEIRNQIIIFQLVQNKNGKSVAVNSDKKGSEIYRIINIYDTIRKTVIDTFEYVDTIRINKFDTIKVYDTIKIINKKAPFKKIKYPYFTRDLNFSTQIGFFKLTNRNGNAIHFQNLQEIKRASLGFSLGPSWSYHLKYLIMQSGVYYNLRPETYVHSYTVKSTVYRFEPDSVFSSWQYVDSLRRIVPIYVHTNVKKPKEIIHIAEYKTNVFYHSLQIPLVLGYKRTIGDDNFEIKGGIYSELFLFAHGKGFFSRDSVFNEKISSADVDIRRINFSAYFDIGYNFHFENYTYLTLEFFYYRNLNSFYNSSFWYSQKFIYPGIKLSLRKIIQ